MNSQYRVEGTGLRPRALHTRVFAHIGLSGLAAVFVLLAFGCGNVMGQDLPQQGQAQAQAQAQGRERALLAKYSELSDSLHRNAYGRPIHVESAERSSSINGDTFGVLDAPFETVSRTFQRASSWCEVLILHLNTKGCRVSSHGGTGPHAATLRLNVGKKTPQSLDATYALDFDMSHAFSGTRYFRDELRADKGPLGTSDYRIDLEAVPLANGKTFIHLRYSYAFGLTGKLAMQGYLATVGSEKVGFSRVATGGANAYVNGLRGAVERNTMRYYLAIEAYLDSLDKPPAVQRDSRLEYWFDATEEYPLQLHEVDRNAYLSMKKAEYQRQSGQKTGGA